MERKTYTQFGNLSVIILVPMLIISLVLLLVIGFDNLILVGILILLAITSLLCILIFYKLTISIDSNNLSFNLGVGLFSKKYLIADIKSCKPVKNNPFYGIGIRLIPGGWLYNVTGLEAVELSFKNRNSKIRIGTNQPEEIATMINKMIENDKSESTSTYTKKTNYFLILSIILLALILPFGIILSGKREIKIKIENSGFSLLGMYGLTIKYSDIKQLDTISSFPKIRRRTNGYAFGRTLKGNFTLNDQTKVKLFITEDNPPYIYVKSDDVNIYINFKNRDKTVELFKILTSKLRHN
jgi:hypothetical protein